MKKYFNFLFSAFLLTSFGLNAQVQWEKDYRFCSQPMSGASESIATAIETEDGGYLIGGTADLPSRTAYMAKLDANGDSLWVRYYDTQYCNFNHLPKLYRNNDDKLYGIFTTLYGRITFAELDETNGDTLSTFMGPMGPASNYNYMAHVQMPNGDYILSYASNSAVSIVKRFTPGNINGIWTHDYAGETIGITSMLLDGTDVVMSGYCGADWWQYDLAVTRLDLEDGSVHWTKKYKRNAVFRDRSVGIMKNSAGDYLIAASWGKNSKTLPSVIRVNDANGDSLSISLLETHAGNNINFGFCSNLTAFGSGFVASGEIDQNFNDGGGTPQNVGQMALMCITDNGQIVNAYAMNDISTYYNGFNYAGSTAYGLTSIATSDDHVLLAGVGVRLAEGNGSINPYGDSYVSKIAPAMLGMQEKSTLEGLMVWPNPSGGSFHISASEKLKKILVCDQLGAVVMEVYPKTTQTEIELDTAPGVYFYKAFGESSTGSGKLVVR